VAKNNDWKYILLTLVTCVLGFSVFAQITPERFQQFISENKHLTNADVRYPSQVSGFYGLMNFRTAWIQKENAGNLTLLLNALKQSADMGLQETDYQYKYIEPFRKGDVHLQSTDDSMEAEIRITDAALHFYNDIAFGNSRPFLGYNGLNYTPGCQDVSVFTGRPYFRKYIAGIDYRS
jgi:L,D-transpeptidase YcbB